MARAPSGSNPVASHRGPSTKVAARISAEAIPATTRSLLSITRRLPKRRVSMLAADRKTSLARITPTARQPARTIAVRLS